jgi:GNAT superfamily N-acetyltransferase
MPQFSKVYFIRKDFKDKIIAISETAYEFKIFNKYSEELNEFILNRCKESGNLLFNVYSEVITSRFNKGMTACAILQKRKIVSLFFTSTQDCTVEQVNYTYRPQNNEIAIIDIYTLADYRKKGLYSLLLQHVISYYRKSGMSIFVMWIMKHNRATIQAQLKLGFTDIFQTVSLFSWLGFEKNSVNISLQPLKGL